MALYHHVQEVKNAEQLPDSDKIGVCLTCTYWEAIDSRSPDVKDQLALCVQHELKAYALIVSGSSGCNKWALKDGVDPAARQYAEEGAA